jgi:MFS family permease
MPYYFAGYLLSGSYVTARGLAIAQGRALVQSANMGVAYGMLETVSAFAIVLGPPLAGLLYQTNPASIYSVSLVLILAGLAANLLFSPLRQKDVHSFDEEERAQLT